MDIFEVLAAISRKKKIFMHRGISEYDALKKAEQDISKEYHIPMPDIKKLDGHIFNNDDIRRQRRMLS